MCTEKSRARNGDVVHKEGGKHSISTKENWCLLINCDSWSTGRLAQRAAALFPASFSFNRIHRKGRAEDGRERNVLQRAEILGKRWRMRKFLAQEKLERDSNILRLAWILWVLHSVSQQRLRQAVGRSFRWKPCEVNLPRPLPYMCRWTGCSAFLPSKTIFLPSDYESRRRRYSLEWRKTRLITSEADGFSVKTFGCINNQRVGNLLSIEKFEKHELLLTNAKHVWVCWSSLHEQSWANTFPSPPGSFLLKLVLASGTVCVVWLGMPTVVGVPNCLQSFPLDSHWEWIARKILLGAKRRLV